MRFEEHYSGTGRNSCPCAQASFKSHGPSYATQRATTLKYVGDHEGHAERPRLTSRSRITIKCLKAISKARLLGAPAPVAYWREGSLVHIKARLAPRLCSRASFYSGRTDTMWAKKFRVRSPRIHDGLIFLLNRRARLDV